MSDFKNEFPDHPHMTQCAMTGRLYVDSSYGVWDDGEWISWDYINAHIEDVELLAEYPGASLEAIHAFEDLIDALRRYHEATDRFVEIWGELGELYAELKFGIQRHPAYRAGSDGVLDGELVEIKTLSPGKLNDRVEVKSSGDFTKLIIVKISEDLEFDAKIVDRSSLRGKRSRTLKTRWREHGNEASHSNAEDNRWQRLSRRIPDDDD